MRGSTDARRHWNGTTRLVLVHGSQADRRDSLQHAHPLHSGDWQIVSYRGQCCKIKTNNSNFPFSFPIQLKIKNKPGWYSKEYEAYCYSIDTWRKHLSKCQNDRMRWKSEKIRVLLFRGMALKRHFFSLSIFYKMGLIKAPNWREMITKWDVHYASDTVKRLVITSTTARVSTVGTKTFHGIVVTKPCQQIACWFRSW